ncbi:MAG: L-threonylcarbamoyladenylate synthase [Candidatus Kapabacteria bacterium]|jgi:tRNA threonylcarbamoyl adenosine modification protein (Sua5/YciO/YrdC/YwlC family)|nr:L-threonylcarbamoyladenylate synthase [Candidatus Kapabacteria bacterium]
MSALILNIHQETPEINKIEKVVSALRDGAVILYPTDTQFTLGCALSNKEAISKLRSIRKLPESQSLTFLCDSLSNVSEFAKVSDDAYRLIKRLIPGPYTFILPASKLVPKFAQNPKRSTAGIRVPENNLSQALLKSHGYPIISISAKLPDKELLHPDDIIEGFSKLVDIAVSSDDYKFTGESSIIDMTTEKFEIVREGAGMSKLHDFIND